MVSIIKKQILKHLSKFTKNLSADKINLSTLRGEGELSNLELDCVALQNLVNLPTWLEFKCANCNKVSVKIAWTKLKTSPICIFLDAVEVEMVTCEKPRAPNGPSPIQASASSGDTSYGFTEKVLEGMTVNINSISVNFSSAAFHATFQLSQLMVFSTNPNWAQSDLRFSRITDKTLGQVLTFKKISWQTMRIVADAVTTSDKSNITPVRLITNQSEIKMIFRRRISDCAILASQLHIHFDDLLWVLTDSQVQSALLCVKSLRDTIERSSQQMRDLGLVKPQEAQVPAKPPSAAEAEADDHSSTGYFAKHTIVETSIHLDLDRVDLHICEEGTPVHKAPNRKHLQGGAIQIALHNLKVDHYPYHKAASDRTHFRDYADTMMERNSWADGIIKQFRKDFVELKKATEVAGNLHAPPANKRQSRLSESCLSVRLTDIDIHKVTTSSSQKQEGGRLLNSTRKELLLPDEMPLFHFIRTEYYYPDGRDYPAPHNNIFMQVNAPQLRAYWDSLIWLDRLATTTVQAVQKMLEDLGIIPGLEEEDLEGSPGSALDEEHVDIRIQILMPKIFIPGPLSTNPNKPHGLEIQVSRAAITNCREGTDCSRTHLKYILNRADKQHFARNPDSFPGEKGFDMPFMQDMLRQHANGDDLPLREILQKGDAALRGNALKTTAAKDVWAVDLEQVWIDFILPASESKAPSADECDEGSTGGFLGLDKSVKDPITNGKHLPFLDSFPVMLWISETSVAADTVGKLASPSTSHASSLSASVKDFSPVAAASAGDHVGRSRSHTDITAFTTHNGHAEKPCPPTFSSSTPDLSKKSNPSDKSPSSLDSDEGRPDKRNRRLLDYYRVKEEEEGSKVDKPTKEEDDVVSQESRDISTASSSPSHRSKTVATHIVIHTDKSLRLQLDHHQYVFLLRLIDMVEDVGKQLDLNSELVLNSTPSSTLSTPSHSVNVEEAFNSSRIRRKRAKPVNTTSIRLSAPTADLFLILRPPPQSVSKVKRATEKKPLSETKSDVAEKSQSVKGNTDKIENSPGGDVQPAHAQLTKTASVAQDTPPLSECDSDSVSILGSDTVSIFGDSVISVGGTYPHFDSHSSSPVQPQFHSSANEMTDGTNTPLLPKEVQRSPLEFAGDRISFANVKKPSFDDNSSALIRQKSGSLSVLSNGGLMSDVLKNETKKPHRNHSSDNLILSGKLPTERLSFSSATGAKSSSSGYESGSHESLPPPTVKSIAQPSSSSSPRSTHSHSSSDASDQFVMIQVDEDGKGLEESSTVKIVRKQKSMSPTSSIPSETSSISSSQSLPVLSETASKCELEKQDSMSSCGMADSQITVTNAKSTTSLTSESGDDDDNVGGNVLSAVDPEEEQAPEPDMSSVLHLHVSNWVGLSVDSNDASDSVVKIAATTVSASELGSMETEKVEGIFVEYSPKKITTSLSKTGMQKYNSETPQVCLRIDTGPLAQRFSQAAVTEGHIQIGADNIPLTVHSSTLANLGAFLEDEIVPKIVPMKIEAQGVQLTIKDDLPPIYDVTPPAPPITLNVHSASILRCDDGTFHVTTSSAFAGLKASLDSLSKPLGGFVDNCKAVQCNRETDVSPEAASVKSAESNSPPSHKVPVSQQNGTISPVKDNCSDNKDDSEAILVDHTPPKSNMPNSSGGANPDSDIIIEALRDQLRSVEMERDSLAAALRYMQEELISSERERSNLRAQCN